MANILTIDDDINVRKMMARGLSALGHKVIEADNGRKGLRLAIWRKIDVMLLDISMPGMNGLEVLRRLKENRRTRHIPVIMLTGQDDPELMDQARFDYAEDYLMKTSGLTRINEQICKLLALIPERPFGWPTALRW